MTEHLVAAAETTKLARVLGLTDPTELDFLVDLPPSAIRQFRERATDLLFDTDAKKLKGVAAASKLVPTSISAKIAERAFGPVLCAATASTVDPQRAIDIAKALPPRFLGECAVQLDPRRTAAIITAVPPKMVADVARELLARGDHITMGRFVHLVEEPALRAAAPIMSDVDLLRIGFLLEDKTAIDNVLHIVADRVPGIIRAAAEQHMWAEGIDLLHSIAPANRAWIGDITAELDTDTLHALINAVHELDAWPTLIPIASAMSPERLHHFAQHPAMQKPDILRAVITSTAHHELWTYALPLVDALPDTTKPELATHLTDLTREQLLAGLLAAARSDNIHTLVDIALAQDHDGRTRILEIIDTMDDIEEFLTALTPDTPTVVWEALIEVRDEIPPTLLGLLTRRAHELDHPTIATQLEPATATTE